MPILRTTARLVFPTGSQGGTNTWHINVAPGDEVQGLAAFGVILEEYYTDVKAALWSTGYSAQWDGNAITVDDASPQAFSTPGVWTNTGTAGGGSPAAGVGLVVTWRTALASRSGRGRTFHAPMRSDCFQDDGTISAAARGDMNAAADQLITASVAAADWTLVVWSPTDSIAREVTSFSITDRVAYLSSRRS